MLTIGATKKLTELSLPGTHDSGTYPGVGGDTAQTQTMTIRQQLDSGIRVLDIRLKYYDLLALRNCNANYTSSNCVVKASFGKRAGMPGFDARADITGDGVVDIRDLSFIAQKLPAGTTCS